MTDATVSNAGGVTRLDVSPRVRAILVVVGLAALAALFWPTLWSMISIWWRSATFAHGFLVFPISAYLAWRRRHLVASLPQQPDLRALPVLLALGLGWTLARITDVLVVEQLAFVAMIPTMVWLMLGGPAVRALVMPLGFLIFAVPLGEALIYPLMQFTAAFTVYMLQLTGIPVFWEGTFFSIPSGDWSVVEGCSGVRYLIASLFLGVLYAYAMYRTLWRRVLFVALAGIFPIIANGLRAYLIVIIAHLSGMKLALGVDHLIYGWVFFGIVVFALFWLGTLWRERDRDEDPLGGGQDQRPPAAAPVGPPGRKPVTALVLGLLVVGGWPVWDGYLSRSTAAPTEVELDVPAPASPWRRDEGFTEWEPRFVAPTAERRLSYTDGRSRVGLYLSYYGAQEQGAELVNSQNVLVVEKHPVWKMPEQRSAQVRLNDRMRPVVESELRSDEQNLLVWHWYWIDDRHVSNPYLAKLREAIAKLRGRYDGGTGIVLFTPMKRGVQDARGTLQAYVEDMLPAIEASVRNATERGDGAPAARQSARAEGP